MSSTPKFQSGNGWDRPGSVLIAAELERIRQRKALIPIRLRALLAHKTQGSDVRILHRARRITELVNEYNSLEMQQLSLELL